MSQSDPWLPSMNAWDGVIDVALREDLLRTLELLGLGSYLVRPELHTIVTYLNRSGSYWPHSEDPREVALRIEQMRALQRKSISVRRELFGDFSPGIDNP